MMHKVEIHLYYFMLDVFEQSLKGGFADSKSYLDIWLLNMDYHRRRVINWHAGIY